MRKNKLRKSDLVILALRCSQLETSPALRSGAAGVSSVADVVCSGVTGVSSVAAEGVCSHTVEVSSGVTEVSSDTAEGNKLPCEDCPFKNNAGCVDLLMAELAQTLWRTLPACTRK